MMTNAVLSTAFLRFVSIQTAPNDDKCCAKAVPTATK